jgi:hypothetical protein
MSRPASSTLETASKPVLKNPLRASTMPLLRPEAALSEESQNPGSSTAAPAAEVSPQQLRQMQISEFSAWLRTQTSKHQRPFQDETSAGTPRPPAHSTTGWPSRKPTATSPRAT